MVNTGYCILVSSMMNSLFRKLCTTSIPEIKTTATSARRKVIKVGDNRPIVVNRRNINAEHEKKASQLGLGFRIVSAR